jgi:hypothetical protein
MASSEIRSFGCVAIARASSILRNSTWLSLVADTSAFDARPIRVRIDIMMSRRCAAETGSSVTAAKSSATMRFSATVMLLNGRGIWKLRAMPRRVRICGCKRVMSSSRNTTVPGSVRNAPEIQLISVVFPEPFGPMRPKRSPGQMSTLTLSSAVKPPKRLVSAEIRSKGAWVSGDIILRARCDCGDPLGSGQ